jgi:DNA-directed RNA polymerase specialized sigma24 family protein
MVRRKALQLARLPEFKRCDVGDLQQDLALKLWKARRRFDAAQACWHGFASVVLDRQARTLLRDRRVELRNLGRTASLNKPVAGEDGAWTDLACLLGEATLDARRGVVGRDFVRDADLAADLAAAIDSWPGPLRDLAEGLKHAPLAEVARARGLPRSTLCHVKRRVREALERRGFQDRS